MLFFCYMKVAVYISGLHKIGGIETFAINLCNRTGFDLIFDTAEISALKKLKYKAYHLDHYPNDYDVLIIATAWGKMPNIINAKKYVQMVHADYEAYIKGWEFKYSKLPYTTHHIAVGKHVAKQFEKVTDYKIDKVIYNLLEQRPIPKKTKSEKLSFITLSRISREKGFERMLIMAEKMKDVDYVWNIFGDSSNVYSKAIVPKFQKYKQIKFCGLTSKPLDEIVKHDYLVQLSDTEGFPYSVYESLQCLTPVISTDYPSAHELIKHGNNGYILDMELSNFDIDMIKNVPEIVNFTERSTENDWYKFLNEIL